MAQSPVPAICASPHLVDVNIMEKALITGITGQDGSYTAELLLSKVLAAAGEGAILAGQRGPRR